MAVENDGRRSLVGVLKRLGLHAHAIEAGDTCPGFPDVEYCGPDVGQGVLEVKRLDAWPKRTSTPIRLPRRYLKRAQVSFMKRRWRAGGTAGLALQVAGRAWFLLAPAEVVHAYDREREAIAWDQTWLVNRATRLSGSRGLRNERVHRALLWLKNECQETVYKANRSA